MTNTPAANGSAANVSRFVTYVTGVLTVVMLLFPPYTSLNGTEYAFLLTGPEWSRAMGAVGAELGLTARIHWIALGVQLGAVWAIALGARWFLGTGQAAAQRESAPAMTERHRS